MVVTLKLDYCFPRFVLQASVPILSDCRWNEKTALIGFGPISFNNVLHTSGGSEARGSGGSEES